MEKAPFCISVQNAELMKDEIDPSNIASGNPEVSSLILSITGEHNEIVRGIWQCTEGTVTDVEQDEMFTVIEGRATVTVENGPVLELSPGVVGFFRKGDKTTWVIHERLRKTFQITSNDD
jgi:hypothetical protein